MQWFYKQKRGFDNEFIEKSMVLEGWPATIQERPKRTWTHEVDAHEGHSGKPLEFLRFPVGAG